MGQAQALSLIADDNWPEPPKPKPGPEEFMVSGIKLKTTPVFDSYWYFAAERQRIFFRKVRHSNRHNLSNDPIFQDFKFTNSYRASDRVSQFLISEVVYPNGQSFSDEDTFFRILLFKLFNKIETWRALKAEFGELSLATYNFEKFDTFLTQRRAVGERIYAAAYIMPSAGRVFGHKSKHSNHLALIEWMLENKFPEKLRNCERMADGFDLFSSAPSLGPFLAYQFITDINYGQLTNFSEMEFVVPGPGALDGISKCFEDTSLVSPTDIIKSVAQQQRQMFDLRRIYFPSLWGRELQLIDCQNLFCEISKYSRVAFPEISGVSGRTRIKQKYKQGARLEQPFYPPDWGLNDKIAALEYPTYVPGSEIARTKQLNLL